MTRALRIGDKVVTPGGLIGVVVGWFPYEFKAGYGKRVRASEVVVEVAGHTQRFLRAELDLIEIQE